MNFLTAINTRLSRWAMYIACTGLACLVCVVDYSVIMRDDGARQWAYKGQPLYYFARDTKAGDKQGEGVGGVWSVARP